MGFAARIDGRVEQELRREDLDQPVAEIWRRLGSAAARLGVARPGYGAVRLAVDAERRRRAERDAALEVAARLALTRTIVPTSDGVRAAFDEAVRQRRP